SATATRERLAARRASKMKPVQPQPRLQDATATTRGRVHLPLTPLINFLLIQPRPLVQSPAIRFFARGLPEVTLSPLPMGRWDITGAHLQAGSAAAPRRPSLLRHPPPAMSR